MAKNIAVIGCGYWGKNLVRSFYEAGRLSTICDISEEALKDLQKKCPEVKITISVDDVWNDKAIKGVVISAPAAEHYSLTKQALLNGKDVFVEKPLALDVKEGKELVSLADKEGQILMVGHILNYHPVVTALKKLVAGGKLGRIQYIYSNRLNFGKIRREENILWSFAPHDIALILHLLNEEPEEVSAKGSNYLHPKIADVTVSLLKFGSGVNAHIFVSWLHPFKEQKLIVVGDKQMAVFDDTATWEKKLTLYPHEVVWTDGIPSAKKADGNTVPLEQEEPLKAECRHFLECIDTRTKPVTDGEEGLKVLRVLDALQRSVDCSGAVVFMKKDSLSYYAHDTSVIDEGAVIGEGSKIWHFSHVMKGARLGKKCNVGQNVVILPGVEIGDNVKIQNNVSVYTGVVVEDDAFLGPSMVFTNVYNPRSFIERKNEYKQTIVKKGATIGANTTIVCGHTIGEYAFIGAGAVVTKDVPPYALVYGSPAEVRGWACRCGWKLPVGVEHNENVVCTACGSKYRIFSGKVELLEKGNYVSTSQVS